MPFGDIVAALMKYAVNEDYLMLIKSVDEIEIYDDVIHVYFTDGNTRNIAVTSDGVPTRPKWADD